MVWAMVIVVVTVQAVVVVKTVIVREPSAAKMAGVMCDAEAVRAVILTKSKVVAAYTFHATAAKAAHVAGTKATHVATTKTADMAAAEASARHVTTAATAEASASHVTAAATTAATRFRSGRQQAAGKQRCYHYHQQSFHHDTSFFSERSVRQSAVKDRRNALHSDVPMS
jgi:hypothetical protein